MSHFLLKLTILGTILGGSFGVLVPGAAAVSGGLEGSFDYVNDVLRTEAGVKQEWTIPSFLKAAITVFLSFVAVVAAIVIIYGGFMYITSYGDEKKAATAKMLIVYAIVGLFIIGLSAIIVNFVINILISPPSGSYNGNPGGNP